MCVVVFGWIAAVAWWRFTLRRMELETAPSSIEVTESGVLIRWSDGSRSRFHGLWLRDNCRSGGDKRGGFRTFSLTDLNTDLFVLLAELNDDGDLLVEFSDGHESVFDLEWLRANSYEPHDRLGKVRTISNFRAGHDPQHFELPVSKSSDHRALLDAVAEWGVAVVTSVPDDRAALETLVELFDQSARHEVTEVVADPDDWDLLEDGLASDPRTSETYRHTPLGISIVQCVDANSTGGDLVLVDGFDIANDLRDNDPDAFDALSQIRVPFIGGDLANNSSGTSFLVHAPVIALDRDYEIAGVRFAEGAIAPLDVDPPQVEEYYRALISFTEHANDPGRGVHVRLQPGHVLVHDNHRVLQGRTGFVATGGRRHLRLTTVDRDVFHGNVRRLRQLHGRKSVDERFPSGATR